MKVWILALLAAATMTLAACGGDELPDVDPSDVLAAADSAVSEKCRFTKG